MWNINKCNRGNLIAHIGVALEHSFENQESNEPLGVKGQPLVGEEVHKEVGSRQSRKLVNFKLHTE
jgi:hypothetical protein